jgi:hypothetical protein
MHYAVLYVQYMQAPYVQCVQLCIARIHPTITLVYSIYSSQSAPPAVPHRPIPRDFATVRPAGAPNAAPYKRAQTASCLTARSQSSIRLYLPSSMPSEHTILCIRRTNPPTSPQFGRTNHCAIRALRCIARYQSVESYISQPSNGDRYITSISDKATKHPARLDHTGPR